MIHVSKLFELVQAHKSFSLQFVASSGEVVTIDQCRCTSFFSAGKTMNVQIAASGQIRKVNRNTITKLNGQEVFL